MKQYVTCIINHNSQHRRKNRLEFGDRSKNEVENFVVTDGQAWKKSRCIKEETRRSGWRRDMLMSTTRT
jgi:hypothetical protein